MTAPDTPLSALRAVLLERGLDGFIVPHADEYLGEYQPASSRRLEWLCGFTGSAGLAMVLSDHASVFVDGRYTLQVAAEVDGDAFAILDLVAEPPGGWPPGDWLAEHAGDGAKIGYDPRLHTTSNAANLRAAAKRAGAQLETVATNPLDAAWKDRPAPPNGPVVAHPQAYAGKSASEKCRDIAQSLRHASHDAAVLTQADSIAWVLNIRGDDVPFTPLVLCFAIIHADARVDLFVDAARLPDDLAHELSGFLTLHAPEALEAQLAALAKAGKKIRLDADTTPVWFFDVIKAADAEPVRGDDPCLLPKACKTDSELSGIRAAHVRDGAALSRFLYWLDEAVPGGDVSELSAAKALDGLRAENDLFQGLSFPTISGAGPNGAIVHYRVTEDTNRPLATNSLYLVDSGAQYLDGTTDVTRTVAIGTPSAEMRDRFTRVLKGHIALACAVFPIGTTGSQLDGLARAPLWAAGLDYNHGTGHGVGFYLSVHEGPQRISKVGSRVALAPGMVVSNEPGYYKTDAYGIRIENLVCVTALDAPPGAEKELLGFETLTLAPIDRRLIDTALLDAAETAWVDAYHARVADTLVPLLDDRTAAWLKAATAPLTS